MRTTRLLMHVRAALAACLLFSTPARADFVFTLKSGISASSGSTGNAFDVLLTNTGLSPVTVGGFSFGITAADPAIDFTEANISTTVDTYVFNGNSFFGPSISTVNGQTLEASDLPANFVGTSVGALSTVGIGHVLFDVASNANPGPVAVTFEGFPTTSRTDANGNNLDVISLAGTITITGTTTVPEPAEGGVIICALTGFAILMRRRRT